MRASRLGILCKVLCRATAVTPHSLTSSLISFNRFDIQRGDDSVKFFALIPIVVACLLPPSASAVEPGSVVDLMSAPGTVLVIRGSEVFELNEGDAVFEGDRIFTRNYGALVFKFAGCNKGLGGRQMLEVKAASFCTDVPTVLEPDATVAGISIVDQNGGGAVGGTPTILAALLASGGVAAAASQDGGPASP